MYHSSLTFFRATVSLSLILLLGSHSKIRSQDLFTSSKPIRERISINEGWRFMRYTSEPDKLVYDERPVITSRNENVVADTRPSETRVAASSDHVLKKYILPTANDFIKDPARHHRRPQGNPGRDFPFVQSNFNDRDWKPVNLPHDWAANGPFYEGPNAEVGGGMGRLPSQGVGWYRRKLNIPVTDKGKSIYLDIDGAMSYAMVWLNGNLVGGWPYGYNSFRLDLSPYINFGGANQLAIRIDNPNHSARWYPGGGIYRNVWLTKLAPVHIAHWGTFIRNRNVNTASATLDLTVKIENSSKTDQRIEVVTEVFALNAELKKSGKAVAVFPRYSGKAGAGKNLSIDHSVMIKNPLLWGPPPTQKPNLYVAVTRLMINGKPVDQYETRFGIRSLKLL